jgi:hypothetical protein
MEYNVQEIIYDGIVVPLFYHDYNCGHVNEMRTTERTVEIALADYWLNKCGNNVVEIGAVTPYYFPGRISTLVDPVDKHERVSDHKSLFTYDIRHKNILSISTIEHIGTKDYEDVSVAEDAVSALKYILNNSYNCLVTFPFGYNKKLDVFVTKTNFGKQVCITYIYRGLLYNDWKVTAHATAIEHMSYGPKWANALVVVEKL